MEKEKQNLDKVEEIETEGDTSEEELGGPKGPEPTRYGDWEKDGRCVDF